MDILDIEVDNNWAGDRSVVDMKMDGAHFVVHSRFYYSMDLPINGPFQRAHVHSTTPLSPQYGHVIVVASVDTANFLSQPGQMSFCAPEAGDGVGIDCCGCHASGISVGG